MLPESPRAALRRVVDLHQPPVTNGSAGEEVARVAELAGAPRRIAEAWREVDRVAELEAADPIVGERAPGLWHAAAVATEEWLRPARREPREVDAEESLLRAVAAAERCGRCGRWWTLDRGEAAAS